MLGLCSKKTPTLLFASDLSVFYVTSLAGPFTWRPTLVQTTAQSLRFTN